MYKLFKTSIFLVKFLLKYVLSLLKVLASIFGLIVAAATPVLIWDAASIRPGSPLQHGSFDSFGNYVINVSIPIRSQAYFFEIIDGEVVIKIVLENGSLVDEDSQKFNLKPGENITLKLQLVIDNATVTALYNNETTAYSVIIFSYWMGYQNIKLLQIKLSTKTEIKFGGG